MIGLLRHLLLAELKDRRLVDPNIKTNGKLRLSHPRDTHTSETKYFSTAV